MNVTNNIQKFPRKLRKDQCERCQAFLHRLVYQFYCLKALIALEQVNTSVVKKRRILMNKSSWSGAVNFHCMQMSLVMSMQFIFGDD